MNLITHALQKRDGSLAHHWLVTKLGTHGVLRLATPCALSRPTLSSQARNADQLCGNHTAPPHVIGSW